MISARASRWLASAALLTALLSAEPCRADDEVKRVTFDVAARAGYAIPNGRLTASGSKLRDLVAGQFPFAIELNFRPLPAFAVGGYADVGPGIKASRRSDLCTANDTHCSLLGVHLGLMLHVRLRPEQAIDPWFGAGVGLETLSVRRGMDAGNLGKVSLSGPEVPLRFGVDFKLADKFFLGPYVGYTIGRFTAIHCEGLCSPAQRDIAASARSTHAWFHFGAKLTVLAFGRN